MMRSLLGNDTDNFLLAMQQPPVCSVRLNSRKPGASFTGMTPVKWCSTGFYLQERPVFTLDPLLHAGAYYVQDASSMIYREITYRITNILGNGDPDIPVCVLDMCAAPGGKTTAIIDAVTDGSRIVANEFVAKRATILRENLTKWGYPQVTVTNRDTSFFSNAGDTFDIVAVDAPCSGEGMMRKDDDAVAQWSPELIQNCASLQRKILANAADCVKPGGFLIYSTCTFNHVENEENAQFIRDSLNLIPVDLDLPSDWGIPRGIDTDIPVYRFMPHKTQGEGLFLAVFRKPGEWVPSHLSKGVDHPTNLENRKTKHTKTPIHLKERNENGKVPDIDEILSLSFDRSRYPEAELSEAQAIAYLRRESIVLDSDVPKGLVIVTYKGLPLGPVKNIGSRANNLYPKNWRIRMN